MTINVYLKKYMFVLLLFVLLPLTALAGPVDESAARQRAQAFLQERGKSLSKARSIHKAPQRRLAQKVEVPAYYVFNVGEADGFVVVSGDDRTTEILGYADSGNLDMDALPDGLQYLLEGYETQISFMNNEKVTSNNARKSVSSQHRLRSYEPIKPLIESRWSQGKPYNNLCPEIDGTKTVTGCVATSMAQVMYYYKWPESECTDLPGYSQTVKDKDGNSHNLTLDPLPATTFDWNAMTPTYTSNSAAAANDAVAKLMQYCGVSLWMHYGLSANGGSGAYNEHIPYALKTYFGFDKGVHHAYRKRYSYLEWVDMIYSELEDKRPVILGGTSCGGGHSFVCDGFDTNNHNGDYGLYFHINWGWAGSSDGYFLLSLLNPDEQGIGGSSTLDGFSYSQNAVLGIQKPTSGTDEYFMSLEGFNLSGEDATLSTKTYTRNSETDDFDGLSLHYYLSYDNLDSNVCDVLILLYNDEGTCQKSLYCVRSSKPITWTGGLNINTGSLTIPSDVKDGTYYIKVYTKPYIGEPPVYWQECYDGDAYKITAVIDGDNLTVTIPHPENVLPASVSFLVSDGEAAVGIERQVTAVITGGSGNYRDDLILRVNGTPVMGTVANIPAGETVSIPFSFIPSEVGDQTLTLWTKKSGGSQITGSETININNFVIFNNASNSKAIEKNTGRTANVKLADRTLYKDGKWNTICLPFNLTLEGSVLAGAEARTLSSASLNGSTISLEFDSPATELIAGVPYIIKWDEGDDIVEPVFEDVILAKGYNDFVSEDNKITFCGTYAYTLFKKDVTTSLLMGGNNSLFYPLEGAKLGACRAFFKLNDETLVKEFKLNFCEDDATSLSEELRVKSEDSDNVVYDLCGRKFNGLKKGIYIINGKKVLY